MAYSHPGGLDSRGGHKVKATGEYHRHKKSAKEGSAFKDAVIMVVVLRVIDGDTFVARFPGGEVEKVRLKGIDTPERGERGFHEATALLKSRIGSKNIDIKVGVHKREGRYLRGHYGRVLADIIGETTL
ncbi:MAG: YHYH domain-containing protein [Proteobacteria bacterium]|nr:YHYH domain-containing protein [Pseudomonadota bacterium]